MSLKIVLTRSMVPSDVQYIKTGLDTVLSGQYEFVIPEEFTEDCICEAANDADILLGPFVTEKIISAAKSLKLIQIPWTGMDTFDFSAVQNITIPVCNTHSNADSVAELGISMILDLLKKLSYHDRKMRIGNWNRDQQPLNLKSGLMCKQTICVLGFGNIGSRIGRLADAFGAKVNAVNSEGITGNPSVTVYPPEQMKAAWADADVVVCALPLTDSTRGMLDADMIASMKDGALLVNVSRAAVIQEDAVWDALQNEKLGGFASDVWWNAPKRGETESYPSAKHEFWKLDNVVMSPHRAGFIENSLPHLDGAIENIIALVKGEPLKCVVDIHKGY